MLLSLKAGSAHKCVCSVSTGCKQSSNRVWQTNSTRDHKVNINHFDLPALPLFHSLWTFIFLHLKSQNQRRKKDKYSDVRNLEENQDRNLGHATRPTVNYSLAKLRQLRPDKILIAHPPVPRCQNVFLPKKHTPIKQTQTCVHWNKGPKRG